MRKQPAFPPCECHCGRCGHDDDDYDDDEEEEDYGEEGGDFQGGEIDPALLSMLTQWAMHHMH